VFLEKFEKITAVTAVFPPEIDANSSLFPENATKNGPDSGQSDP
jgi:hypothetical protein